ncbi:acyltransferase family protein, partial [Corynebacterium variabile]
RRLVESNPERWEFLTGMNARIFTGFAVCVVTGWIFYRIGRLPVIGWILYPPALPRRRAVA